MPSFIERILFVFVSAGVQIVSVEMQKDLVTVTGTMDVAALVESLKTKMRRVVEVVPQKKEKENKEGKEKDKEKGKEKEKEKEGGDGEGNEKEGGEGGNGGGGKKKKKGGGGGGGGGAGGGGENGGKEAKYEHGGDDGGVKLIEGNRMEYLGLPGFANTGYYGYGNPPLPGNGFGYGNANGAVGYYGTAIPYPGYSYVSGSGPTYVDPCHAPQMFSDENPNACSVM